MSVLQTCKDFYLVHELLYPFVVVLMQTLDCNFSPIPQLPCIKLTCHAQVKMFELADVTLSTSEQVKRIFEDKPFGRWKRGITEVLAVVCLYAFLKLEEQDEKKNKDNIERNGGHVNSLPGFEWNQLKVKDQNSAT